MEKHGIGKCNWETAEIGIRTPLKLYIYFRFVLEQHASSRPHFPAVRIVLWNMVKNCVRNRSRPDEIDTETEFAPLYNPNSISGFVDHRVQSQR